VKKTTIFMITAAFALILMTATAAHAQVKYVAVVETEVDAQSGAAAKLNKAEVRQITTVLRNEARNNLPSGKYKIMTAETVIAQGSAKLEECAEENCVIALGSKIGADFIVRGIVSKFGTKLTLSIEMYETEDGTLVGSARVSSEKAENLLEKTVVECGRVYKTFVNDMGGAQKAQQAAPPTTQPAYQPPAQTYQPPAPTYQQSGIDGSGILTDSRDGKKYKTVVIGRKRWMAENLNYQPQSGNSWCYNNDNSNCGKYGRLYDWNTAKAICSPGWHLPSRQEWNELVTAVGDDKTEGKKLKSKGGWNSPSLALSNSSGTDDYGFSALPGGLRFSGGDFKYAGGSGGWWTATENSNGSTAYSRGIYYNGNGVYEGSGDKSYGFSVRCVQD